METINQCGYSICHTYCQDDRTLHFLVDISSPNTLPSFLTSQIMSSPCGCVCNHAYMHECMNACLRACVKRTLSSRSAMWPLWLNLLPGSSVSLRSLLDMRTYFHACSHGLLAFFPTLYSRFLSSHASACSFHLRRNRRRTTMGIVDNEHAVSGQGGVTMGGAVPDESTGSDGWGYGYTLTCLCVLELCGNQCDKYSACIFS